MMLSNLAAPAEGRTEDEHAPLEGFGRGWDFSITWQREGGASENYTLQGIFSLGDLDAQ